MSKRNQPVTPTIAGKLCPLLVQTRGSLQRQCRMV